MKKKILWVTADYFVDCDITNIPNLTHDFDIHWLVFLPCSNSRYQKDDILNVATINNNLSIHVIKSKFRERDPRKIWEYMEIIYDYRKINPDILYINVVPNSPWQIPMFLSLPKNKTIITAHQGKVHEGMGHYTYYNTIRDLVYLRLKVVNMFSKSQAALFHERYPDSTIYHIPLGLKYFGPSTNTRPESGSIIFLSFGIINYTKHIDLLIDAACNLYEHGFKNFKVSLNGMCKNWDWYQAKIKYPEIFELNIKMIDNDDIPNLFNHSHYLVQPYRVVSQSGPTKVAFSYNVPVLASSLPGFTDEIKENVNGFIFECGNVDDLENKMKYLIENHNNIYPSLIKKMKEYTKAHYSQESILNQYINMFNTVVVR